MSWSARLVLPLPARRSHAEPEGILLSCEGRWLSCGLALLIARTRVNPIAGYSHAHGFFVALYMYTSPSTKRHLIAGFSVPYCAALVFSHCGGDFTACRRVFFLEVWGGSIHVRIDVCAAVFTVLASCVGFVLLLFVAMFTRDRRCSWRPVRGNVGNRQRSSGTLKQEQGTSLFFMCEDLI